MAQELLKSFEEFDEIEDQYLFSDFANRMKKPNVSKRWQLKEAQRLLKIAKLKKNLKRL